MKPTCSIEGCDRPIVARGWCSAHYNRWHRHGDPTAGRISAGVPLQTLRNWIATRDRSECWPWPYGQNGVGYGVVKFRGRYVVATQVALVLSGRPKPSKKLHALHACDNPPCVNPDHLDWGTHSENMRQSVDRGRWGTRNFPRGERCSQAKLTAAQVREIRARAAAGEPAAHLARAFGIGPTQAGRILRRESWNHLP